MIQQSEKNPKRRKSKKSSLQRIILQGNYQKEFRLVLRLSRLYIARGRKWTLALTISLMAVAFINLVFMSSLLTGIVTETERQVRDTATGEIYLTPEKNTSYFNNPDDIVNKLRSVKNVKSIAKQLITFGQLSHNGVNLQAQINIVPSEQNRSALTIDESIVEGEFKLSDDTIILGKQLVAPRKDKQIPITLEQVKIGDKISLNINGITMDLTVGGIFKTKFIETDSTALISYSAWKKFHQNLSNQLTSQLQTVTEQSQLSPELTRFLPKAVGAEINNKLSLQTEVVVKQQQALIESLPSKNAVNRIVIRTDNQPKDNAQVKSAIEDLKIANLEVHDWHDAAGFMGSLSSSFLGIDAIMLLVGIIITAVTIFIIVYVDIINKRRQIGIQRAIGIKPRIIVFSYVLLSIFYAACGIAAGMVIFYVVLVPYFITHPLSLPIADVSLFLPWSQLVIRAQIVLVVSVISGLIPAILASRIKMLDAILGRS